MPQISLNFDKSDENKKHRSLLKIRLVDVYPQVAIRSGEQRPDQSTEATPATTEVIRRSADPELEDIDGVWISFKEPLPQSSPTFTKLARKINSSFGKPVMTGLARLNLEPHAIAIDPRILYPYSRLGARIYLNFVFWSQALWALSAGILLNIDPIGLCVLLWLFVTVCSALTKVCAEVYFWIKVYHGLGKLCGHQLVHPASGTRTPRPSMSEWSVDAVEGPMGLTLPLLAEAGTSNTSSLVSEPAFDESDDQVIHALGSGPRKRQTFEAGDGDFD